MYVSHAPHQRLRSALSGRERWEIPFLRRKPQFSQALEKQLRKQPGILTVKVNAATARILLQFEPRLLKLDTRTLLRRALQHISESWKLEPENVEDDPLLGADQKNALSRILFSDKQLTQAQKKGTLLSLADTAAGMIVPLGLGLIMAVPLTGPLPILKAIGLNTPFSQILVLAGAGTVGKLGALRIERARKKLWHEHATQVEHGLRIRTFQHIESLDLAYTENKSTGQLMNLIYEDTAIIGRFLERIPHSLIENITTVTFVSVLLCSISPVLGVLSLTPLPFIYYYTRTSNRKNASLFSQLREQEDHFNQVLSNALAGLPTIKSFTAENFELERIRTANETTRRNLIRTYIGSTENEHNSRFWINLGVIAGMTYGGLLVLQGTYPVVFFILQAFLVTRLMMTVESLDGDLNLYQNARAAAKRLQNVLGLQPCIESGETVLTKTRVRGDISIRGLSFSYNTQNPVLENIEMEIQARQTVGLAGPTGSGKTTLTKLLLRFYDSGQGTIQIDGHDLRTLRLEDLRQAVGLVSQETYLFHGSIYENILYGKPEAGIEEVIEAARDAEALPFIQKLPQGFNTIVGERGKKLSGGERQRISIARTLLKDPPILILDEATSSLDYETEVAIRESLERLRRNRTTIIIAHRLPTMRHADRIYFLENGTIRESGSHEELLVKNGAYARFWNRYAT